MLTTHGRVVHVGSLLDLDARLSLVATGTSMAGWRVAGLDLSAHEPSLARQHVAGASFVGCTFAPGQAEALRARGALVLPEPARPEPGRTGLYAVEELYDAATWSDSLDARLYAWSQTVRHGSQDREAAQAGALHDHAIDQALAAWVRGRRVVGVMGGHAWRRDDPTYAGAARLARTLAGRGMTVATGGGPGAMEAAGLGAFAAHAPPAELEAALVELARTPTFRPSIDAWVATALTVRRDLPRPGASLSVPTWHYGHEPPHVFATAVAKYFRNATREAVLLEVCDAGIVFLPGAGGTVQEVFQDACENYYADESSVAPMVLVGVEHWTRELPAWPLLKALARGRAMQDHVHLVDSLEEAAELVSRPVAER